MDWKIQAELLFLAPFALLFLIGVAIEARAIRAAVRATKR